MSVEITNQIRIQKDQEFWYTVEDTHLDVGCEGCTISYWFQDGTNEKRGDSYVCMSEEEALAVADAIYKLFKKN